MLKLFRASFNNYEGTSELEGPLFKHHEKYVFANDAVEAASLLKASGFKSIRGLELRVMCTKDEVIQPTMEDSDLELSMKAAIATDSPFIANNELGHLTRLAERFL